MDWGDGEGGGAGRGGASQHEEENPDSVYMFAWALDGRRIGEGGTGASGRAESPNSITAPIVRYLCRVRDLIKGAVMGEGCIFEIVSITWVASL